jgi:hypothetical protein
VDGDSLLGAGQHLAGVQLREDREHRGQLRIRPAQAAFDPPQQAPPTVWELHRIVTFLPSGRPLPVRRESMSCGDINFPREGYRPTAGQVDRIAIFFSAHPVYWS